MKTPPIQLTYEENYRTERAPRWNVRPWHKVHSDIDVRHKFQPDCYRIDWRPVRVAAHSEVQYTVGGQIKVFDSQMERPRASIDNNAYRALLSVVIAKLREITEASKLPVQNFKHATEDAIITAYLKGKRGTHSAQYSDPKTTQNETTYTQQTLLIQPPSLNRLPLSTWRTRVT